MGRKSNAKWDRRARKYANGIGGERFRAQFGKRKPKFDRALDRVLKEAK